MHTADAGGMAHANLNNRNFQEAGSRKACNNSPACLSCLAKESMKIKLTSIIVDDQHKALKFYTEVLGFIKKNEFPAGEFKWLTVVSPQGGDVELSLEPNANPAAKQFQEALLRQGIPLTAFEVDDIDEEYKKLSRKGVIFTTAPTQAGPVIIAVFADTCGNLIQIYQPA
jgi:predicted enzyme related to lactoylglutathione lyase